MECKEIKTDRLKRPILSEQDAIDLLLENKRIPLNSVISEDSNIYFESSRSLTGEVAADIFYQVDDVSTYEEFHEKCASTWNIPEEYKNINVLDFLLEKCKTDVERTRILEEYTEFENRHLVSVLQLLIYLVDYFRKNKYMWGVGRGSSTASYALFLIGIHRIDSLRFGLSIDEFLK